jgi:hypothetical protein
MTRFGLLMLLAVSGLAQTGAMRSVYIAPMPGGLDQYLAGQITREHLMTVVADPKIADTVITDRLNDTFEAMLAKLHPHQDELKAEENLHHSFQKTGSQGTLFLVDAKSRQVIWSDYEKPMRNPSGSRLNKAAERIVKKMQAALSK